MENELEAIRNRLLVCEGKLLAQDDYLHALRTVQSQTLQLLHERGLLPLPEVVARLQGLSAFSLAAHDLRPPQMLAALIEAFQSLADAYAAQRK